MNKIRKQAQTGDKDARKSLDLYEKIANHLSKGKSARSAELEEDEIRIMQEMQLITSKPVMYVCNVDESSVINGNQHTEAFKKAVADENAEILFVSAAIESDMADMSREDQMMFLEEMGLTESGVGRLIKSAYHLLNKITYFTAGVKEVRAWTISTGTKAPQAAGEIHSDFEKGFIRAEVMHFEDFVHYGSESACRDAGKLHVEGKDYTVQDGDIMHFRFNV